MEDIRYRKVNSEIECVYYKNCCRSYPPHTHTSHIMLGTVEEGSVCIIQNNEREIIKPGMQFSILPNISHRILPDSDSYSMMVMCVKAERIDCEKSLYQLWEKIINEPENLFMIEEMAETAGLSKFHLIRVFKNAFGLTPHQFQIQCKVRKAQKILEQKRNIGDAVFEAGFCDESHMDRCFQKIIGLTPKEYLASVELV